MRLFINGQEFRPLTIDINAMQQRYQYLESHVANTTKEIKEFKNELIKNYTKTEEKLIENNEIISIDLNREVSAIVQELENDHQLFLQGHSNYVTSVIISNDDKFVISASADKKIII